jgi:uncharacterized protein (TIGR03435 family)
MFGWAGIDTTSGVFKRFGVMPRPTTIIVDGRGRIVAATTPENLTATDLLAVADGKSVKFKPVADVKVPVKTASLAATVKPLYEVSLTKAAPDVMEGMSAGPGYMDMYGRSADQLLCEAYNIQKDQIVPTGPIPGGRYNLHIEWSNADDNSPLITPLLQAAITYGLNLRVQTTTVTKSAYVLKATKAGNKLMIPTAVTTGSMMSMYWKGKFRLVNGSMDDLASGLEEEFEVPVVNETGIKGRFDAELEFPAKDTEAAKTALLKTLGLELIEADRPIQMLEVSPRDDSKKKEESKPQATPKP